MENPGLTTSPCKVLNPANPSTYPQGLSPLSLLPRNLGPLDKTQEGLLKDPLANPEEIWYTDGSSFVLDGKRRAGSTSYNMQCQFNKDIKLQPTMGNVTHPWTLL